MPGAGAPAAGTTRVVAGRGGRRGGRGGTATGGRATAAAGTAAARCRDGCRRGSTARGRGRDGCASTCRRDPLLHTASPASSSEIDTWLPVAWKAEKCTGNSTAVGKMSRKILSGKTIRR